MQLRHAAAVIKAVHTHHQKKQYTLCSVVGKHHIDIAIETAHPGHFIENHCEPNKISGRTRKAVLRSVRDCCCLFARRPFDIVSVSARKGEHLSKIYRNKPGSCRGEGRGCLLYILLPQLSTSTQTPSRPLLPPERRPGAASADCHLVWPQTSSVLFSLLFTLSSHHFFLTNTHQWPHSL
jgi:hypothetical protein